MQCGPGSNGVQGWQGCRSLPQDRQRGLSAVRAGGGFRVIAGARVKSDSLLKDQEAVCLQVVAGARNHLQANRSLGFCFEIPI